MGEEKIYFEDDKYLITSLRFLIREDGQTILIKDLSDPRFIETSMVYHKEYTGGLLDMVFNLLDLQMDRRKTWGEFRVEASLKGKKENLIEWRFYHRLALYEKADSVDWQRNAAEENAHVFGSPAWYELRRKLLDVSIALGAAIAGA